MSKIENTIGGAGVLFVKNVDSNCKIQKILPSIHIFYYLYWKKRGEGGAQEVVCGI